MPVMGPVYSKDQADKAYTECVQLLNEKYKILNFDSFILDKSGKSEDRRQDAYEDLRISIHRLFELDSWESF